VAVSKRVDAPFDALFALFDALASRRSLRLLMDVLPRHGGQQSDKYPIPKRM
jgi:hypothetical protein